MNGTDLFLALSYVGDDLIEEAAREQPAGRGGKYAVRRRRRPVLIAALIAVMLLLTGCAALAVYLRMENLKLGTYSVPTAVVQEQEVSPSELDVFSLQGVAGSAQYLAGQEWYAFTQSYEDQPVVGWDSPPEYWAYNVLDETMVQKLDEICAKYGLKVIGKPWHEDGDFTYFLNLMGIESLLKADCEAGIQIPQGRMFPGGSFGAYGRLTPPGEANEIWMDYELVKKDVFYDVFGYADAGNTTQRNYTTSDGVDVLLLEGPGSGMILVDREDCFINLTLTEPGDTSLETIAEWFDFTVTPTPVDAAAADAREQSNIENDPSKDFGRRSTYTEYIADLLYGDSIHANTSSPNPPTGYTFFDLDGNGEQELLIVNMETGKIGYVVAIVNGKTDEGKSYNMELCEDNILIEQDFYKDATAYHIFYFANNGDPVFSNPKERSIVRLKEDPDGTWWRTSSTDHYADFDTQITEEEAQAILNSYKRVQLDVRPLAEFEEP